MNIFDFEVRCPDGGMESLAKYRGQVLLVVNTASRCGFTPQYSGLESLYLQYRAQGFTVLGFPCNQFLGQEPGTDAEIQSFCRLNYEVSFPVYSRIEVNGSGAHPLYQWLKREKTGLLGGGIKWNFTKFLTDRSGQVFRRYAPFVKPSELASDIELLLQRKNL